VTFAQVSPPTKFVTAGSAPGGFGRAISAAAAGLSLLFRFGEREAFMGGIGQ
jgi:hypothetical protein